MPESTYRVLQIDDDAALCRLVEKALLRLGYAYEHAETAEAGLARIAQGGIDVIVLDHFLDGGIGLSVIEKLKQQASAPPVVYVTGSQEPRVAVDALKSGAADYVIKTVGDEFIVLLINAIEQSIETARLQRQRVEAEQAIRAARDRAEILLHEVNHRVANSLALVAAMVRLQASAVTDQFAKNALNETQARISAIAGLHRRLYSSDDVRSVSLDSYLQSLIDELDTTMRAHGHPAQVRTRLESVRITTDKAVSVGVIVTELLTNAYKYAYPDGRAGEVRVLLHRSNEDYATLIVEDDGIGWNGTGTPKGTGLGTRLISAMAHQLGTTICYGDGTTGTRSLIEIDLA